MSTQLAPVLFLSVSQHPDLAVTPQNDWSNLTNVLTEDANRASTSSVVTDLRHSYTMNLSRPDFPPYPAGEEPSWFKLTLELEAWKQTGTASINNLFIQLASGTRRQFSGVLGLAGIHTRTFSGFLSDWGITQQEANDIIEANGESVNVYCTYDDGDSQLRIYWAKLEAIVQERQTEVLAPPVVF